MSATMFSAQDIDRSYNE